ncbi:peptidase YpeB-like protein [Psychrobacillus insolitus]|uniref:Peptidase YpeB-like protein n=1 Tax=Psychrobacillus insolitus TaxID=1461 RepID=A0A2W7PC15_9BACI|nr:PepSY domain-containing protein [Psychrobacillus insolitus]PZX04589.1 peptidase YpeB-like protein [Psychrobacillus insolitus]
MLTKLKVGLISGSALILLAACGGQEEPTNNSASSTTESSDSSSAAPNFEGKSFSVTYEQAIADFQEAHPSVAISSIDFDKGFGAYSFEINGFDDTQEIEWEINAENGKETKNNTEKKDADNDDRELMVDDLMTIDELITKSEDEAQNAVLVSWNLEVDDNTNTPLFTGEFKEGNNEVDVHLNAETGEFLSSEND